jgi:hypothetical protein
VRSCLTGSAPMGTVYGSTLAKAGSGAARYVHDVAATLLTVGIEGGGDAKVMLLDQLPPCAPARRAPACSSRSAWLAA